MIHKISFLKNPVQEYAWGSKTAIQSILGKKMPGAKPMAELWMGAHPMAPSEVLVGDEWISLNKAISRAPKSILGAHIAEKFSNRLPFLFKILAADKPLSIQVHPDAEQARSGFMMENSVGIRMDAPERNYKDENHKPEILCALTPFSGLKGFRKIEEILDLLGKVTPSTLSKELSLLSKEKDDNGLKRFFASLLTMVKERQKRVVSEAVNLAEEYASRDPAIPWITRLNRDYPGDIGVLSPMILNLVRLEPGEAMYLPAGELHAYFSGAGVELMANSDNVLRGGLTGKHIDVNELMAVTSFKTETFRAVKPVRRGTCETVYPTPAREFLLSMISVKKKEPYVSSSDRSVEILICVEGKTSINDLGSGNTLPFPKGKSVVIPSVASRYLIDGIGTVYKASVPCASNSPPSSAEKC